ncbi:MAG: hypothetical protein Q9208_007247 [Pyrenodesmia sp. 3 TL-2023]
MSIPPEKPASVLEESTLPLDGLSSPANTSSPAPAAFSSQHGVPSPTPPNNKRKPVDLSSADAEDDDHAAAGSLPPPKRARGRPKGSKKQVQAKPAAGAVDKKILRSKQPATSGKAVPRAHETPRKRGRPKGSGTVAKTNTAVAGKIEDNSEVEEKIASGVKGKTGLTNGKASETAGVKKRGRPMKSGIAMKSSTGSKVKEGRVEKTAEVKKRGRPKKET